MAEATSTAASRGINGYLAKTVTQDKDRDDDGGRTTRKGDDSHEEPQEWVSVHPVAWSTTSAENGVPPFGVTLMARPQ